MREHFEARLLADADDQVLLVSVVDAQYSGSSRSRWTRVLAPNRTYSGGAGSGSVGVGIGGSGLGSTGVIGSGGSGSGSGKGVGNVIQTVAAVRPSTTMLPFSILITRSTVTRRSRESVSRLPIVQGTLSRWSIG